MAIPILCTRWGALLFCALFWLWLAGCAQYTPEEITQSIRSSSDQFDILSCSAGSMGGNRSFNDCYARARAARNGIYLPPPAPTYVCRTTGMAAGPMTTRGITTCSPEY